MARVTSANKILTMDVELDAGEQVPDVVYVYLNDRCVKFMRVVNNG